MTAAPAGKGPARAGKRLRRSTDEVVQLLMSAAIEEFEEKSFNGATTAAIARRAGVAEALIFNHFGSKAQLFQDAIFKPLEQHFAEFDGWVEAESASPEDRRDGSRRYAEALVDFVTEHKGMFLALVFAQTYKSDKVEGLADIRGLHDYFAHMAELAAANLKAPPRISPRHMARISCATIMACVLFGDWLFPDDADDPATVRKAIGDFVTDGLAANQGQDG